MTLATLAHPQSHTGVVNRKFYMLQVILSTLWHYKLYTIRHISWLVTCAANTHKVPGSVSLIHVVVWSYHDIRIGTMDFLFHVHIQIPSTNNIGFILAVPLWLLSIVGGIVRVLMMLRQELLCTQ